MNEKEGCNPSDIKFDAFENAYVHSSDHPVVVKTGIATKKLTLILGSIVTVGAIATVGVVLGVIILKKDDRKNAPTLAEINGPIDGQWTYWDRWSDCTVTCSGGFQFRHRRCAAPAPRFGGKQCIGELSQSRQCANWDCPDCLRKCPNNGSLNYGCDICECIGSVLFGKITNLNNFNVEEVSVYLEYRPWTPIATTNLRGNYIISGICVDSTSIFATKKGYGTNYTTPEKKNATHWEGNLQIRSLERPWISRHPQPKVRFIGDSASLCCQADGFPIPERYNWFKDGNILEGKATAGTLTFPQLKQSDAGKYHCRTETVAGAVTSEHAVVDVKDVADDSCNKKPLQEEEHLPEGCFYYENGAPQSKVNVGSCPSVKCIKKSLIDNGTCEDWWQPHRCEALSVENIQIECPDNFTYPISKITSCGCREYNLKTIITGHAFGVFNGNRVPFQQGNILVDGELKGLTTSSGYFFVRVAGENTRAVLTFQDDKSNSLLDSTRVIQIIPGKTTSTNIVIPLKPVPQPFNTNVGFNLPLGNNNANGKIASLSIEGGSIVDSNGNIFEGTANARVHFIDIRNIDDLDTMYGELSFVDEEGESRNLETFGMFQISVEDNSGTPLYINGKLKMSMESIYLNTSSAENEHNDDLAHVWQLDVNSGKWVDHGPMNPQTQNNSTRRKRSSENMEGIIDSDIEFIQHTYLKNNVRRVSSRQATTFRNGNFDKPIQRRYHIRYTLEERTVNLTYQDSCFVRVMAYQNFFFSNPARGISITAVTLQKDTFVGRGKMTMTTNEDGLVCLPIFCDSIIYLKVENGLYYASSNHRLPTNFKFINVANGTQVRFDSRSAFDNGPVFTYRHIQECKIPANDGFFQFAPLVTEPKISKNQKLDEIDSWYTEPETSLLRRICFIKIKIVSDNNAFRVVGLSSMDYGSNAKFGSYRAQPIWDESTNNRTEKAVCIEFRCPGRLRDGTTTIEDIKTIVEVRVQGPQYICIIRNVANGLPITKFPNRFKFIADPANNYGPKYGVFIRAGQDDKIVLSSCHTGKDTADLSSIMKPSVNPAVEFECQRR